MNEIKKTTLHPDNQPNTDLYPKTSTDQIEGLNDIIGTLNAKIDTKLTKPTNPSAESVVTMLADGTVGTKPLSEIGGSGGKLYQHWVQVKSGDCTFFITINDNHSYKYTAQTFSSTYPHKSDHAGLPCVCKATSGVGAVSIAVSPSYIFYSGAIATFSGEVSNVSGAIQSIDSFTDTVTEL